MREVIAYVNLTLDGYLSGPNGELDWMRPDPDMNHALSQELRSTVDTMLEGRVMHEAFEANFRAEAADPASPPGLVDFATWMLTTPKVVFSRTARTYGGPVRVATGDLAEEVAKLKAEPGGDLVIFGGTSTVREFVRLGLVDQYWLKVYPTAIGAGHALFPRRTELRLERAESHASGIQVLRYRPA
jgi:dihydrofolate reductase